MRMNEAMNDGGCVHMHPALRGLHHRAATTHLLVLQTSTASAPRRTGRGRAWLAAPASAALSPPLAHEDTTSTTTTPAPGVAPAPPPVDRGGVAAWVHRVLDRGADPFAHTTAPAPSPCAPSAAASRSSPPPRSRPCTP
jgi:hypothetical protein